jgi:hypothetical protein
MLEEIARRRSTVLPPPEIYLIEVDPRRIRNAAEREALMSIPTTLALPRPLTARIVAAGAKLLSESPAFQRLLDDLGAAPATAGMTP